MAVAAFPTAVDRSARLAVKDGAAPETCRSIEPTLANVHRLSLEVILDTKTPATATIELRDAVGDSLLTFELAESHVVLSNGTGDLLSEFGGLEPGQWHSVEVGIDEASHFWRVAPLDPVLGPGVEAPFEWSFLGSVGGICLGANGLPNAAVHYDNLAVTNE